MQMCYISFLDYFVFTADCAFGKKVKHHMYFTDVSEYGVALPTCVVHPRTWHLGGAPACMHVLPRRPPISGGRLPSPDTSPFPTP